LQKEKLLERLKMTPDIYQDVRKKLWEIEPSLNLIKDQKIFEMISEDFSAYLRLKSWKRIESFEDSELRIWVSLWLSDYRKRVKLILSKEDSKRFEEIGKHLQKKTPIYLDPFEIEDLENLAKFTLLRRGQLCGLGILAKELIRRLQFECSDLKAKDRTELILVLALKLISYCRSLATSSGVLIFIRVDKAYYLEER
jgi:hypothetical protein